MPIKWLFAPFVDSECGNYVKQKVTYVTFSPNIYCTFVAAKFHGRLEASGAWKFRLKERYVTASVCSNKQLIDTIQELIIIYR